MNKWAIIAAVVVVLVIAAAAAALVFWRVPTAAEREQARTLYVQARTQLDAGDQDAALASLAQSIRLDPQNQALEMRARIHIGRRDFEAALRDVDRMISRGGAPAETYSQRCWLRARGENLDDARADCDRAMELNPALASAFGNRGLVRLRQGRHREAWVDFNEALRLGGSDQFVAWRTFGRGVAGRGRGDVVTARQDIETALRANPSVAAEFAEFGLGQEIVRELDDASYERAMQQPSITSFSQYLVVYSSGSHAADARTQIAEIMARVEAEEAAGRQTIPGFALAQARGPGADDSFGAIALSRSTWRTAFSTDYPSPQAAVEAAVRACNGGVVRDCEAFPFRNVCAALAVSRDRHAGLAWAYARDDSQDGAVGQCRARGGRSCVAVHSQCTPTPTEPSSP